MMRIREIPKRVIIFSWRKGLATIGVVIHEDSGEIELRPRRFFGIFGAGFFLFLLGLLLLYGYSTSPSFCNRCHIMEPYYEAWRTSGHNFVPCVKCHYPPGSRDQLWAKFQAMAQVVKYVTRTYGSKPFAEIEDASCLRIECHSKRLLRGQVITEKGVLFDHAPHLKDLRRGKQLRCTSCHSQIVIGSHIEVTYTTCYLCHFKSEVHDGEETPPTGCTSCHPSPTKDIVLGDTTFNHKDVRGACQSCHLDVTSGEGDAPYERCTACHNQPERLARYKDTTLMHKNHVAEHNIECTQCHMEIKHSVKTILDPLQYDCNICHENKHIGQKDMYMGTKGRGVPSMPSHMFTFQVDCVGCHIKLAGEELAGEELAANFVGKTLEASEKGCLNCHGDDFEGILGEWETELKNHLKNIKPMLNKVKAGLAELDSTDENYKQIRTLYEDARYNYHFVEKARGVHNFDYAVALLGEARKNLELCISMLNERKKKASLIR